MVYVHPYLTPHSTRISRLCSPASRIPQVDPKEPKEGGIHQVVPELRNGAQLNSRKVLDGYDCCLFDVYMIHDIAHLRTNIDIYCLYTII